MTSHVDVRVKRETRPVNMVIFEEQTMDILIGSLVAGILIGMILALVALGLTIIFGVMDIVNFAQAELVTWGMLTTYFFNFYGLAGVLGFLAPLPPPFGGGVNLVWAAVFGMVCGGLLGYVLNRFIFRPARAAGVSLIAQMVMTIGPTKKK